MAFLLFVILRLKTAVLPQKSTVSLRLKIGQFCSCAARYADIFLCQINSISNPEKTETKSLEKPSKIQNPDRKTDPSKILEERPKVSPCPNPMKEIKTSGTLLLNHI